MFCFFRTLRQCLLGERCFIKYLLYAKEEIVLSVASDTYRPAGGSVESEQEGPEDGDFLPGKAREDFEQNISPSILSLVLKWLFSLVG